MRPSPVGSRVSADEWAILALLRFCFAAGVFSQHISSYVPSRLTRTLWASGGFPGVAGFLIISGFSIRASYESQQDGYLKRRISRIFPVYVAAMFLALVPFALFGDLARTSSDPMPRPTLAEWVGNLLMLGWLFPLSFPANLPLWTVQVEFLYYLGVPYLARLSSGTAWGIMFLSAAFYAAFPHCWPDGDMSNAGFGLAPLSMLWIWLLGWQLHRGRSRRILIVLMLAAVVALFVHWQGDDRFGIARMSPPLLAITAIGCGRSAPSLGRWGRAIADWLGDLSYEVYAFHLPLMTLLYTWDPNIATRMYWASTLMVSIAFLHLVDRPIRRLGRSRASGRPVGGVVGGRP